MGFVGLVAGQHAEQDLAGHQHALDPSGAADELAVRRKDGGDVHQVLAGDAGRSEGQLKAGQLLLVHPIALGQIDILGNQHGGLP